MPTDLYLDYNGSTPVHPDVVRAALEHMTDGFGNAAAPHPAGRAARGAIDRAREQLARCIGAREDEVFCTSGGTEANNWALKGSALATAGGHLVVSAIEHKSVLATARDLAARGAVALTEVAPGPDGAVRVADVERALRPDTFLVSVMLANNETGVLQPAAEIGALCRARGVRFHTDAVCALGKLPIEVEALACDLLSLSSHKLYAPKGAGLLYVRRGTPLAPLIHGCGQQNGQRGGTEATPLVVAFARATELLARGELPGEQALVALRERLWEGIAERLPSVERNGSAPTLANTLNVHFPGQPADALQDALAERGISVAAGAAAGTGQPSHVLLAMGFPPERARCSLRFSLGAGTDAATLEAVWKALEEVVPAGAGTATSR